MIATKCILCALLCTFLMHSNVQSIRYEGSTDPDYARSMYIQLERNLWEKYIDKNTTLTRNERLYKIFNQHFMFIQQYVDQNYNDEDFKVLSRYYEWTNLESDVKSIHSLFKDNFVYRLAKDLEKNDFRSNGFDERANLDLAETVISDPLWPINATLNKIEINIYQQGLYYKAIAVYCFFLSFTNHFLPYKSH